MSVIQAFVTKILLFVAGAVGMVVTAFMPIIFSWLNSRRPDWMSMDSLAFTSLFFGGLIFLSSFASLASSFAIEIPKCSDRK